MHRVVLAAALLVGATELQAQTQCRAPRVGAGAVQAFVAVTPNASRDSAVVTVCLVPGTDTALKIGSYRGVIRFDSTTARIASVARGPGGMRIENAPEPGRLLFAGANPAGFREPLVLRAVLATRAPLRRVDLDMQELSSTDGADLSERLVTVAHPATVPASSSPRRRTGAR